jgi:hypothetical protein
MSRTESARRREVPVQLAVAAVLVTGIGGALAGAAIANDDGPTAGVVEADAVRTQRPSARVDTREQTRLQAIAVKMPAGWPATEAMRATTQPSHHATIHADWRQTAELMPAGWPATEAMRATTQPSDHVTIHADWRQTAELMPAGWAATEAMRATPSTVATSSRPSPMPGVTRLVTGLANAAGSGTTIGPDGALYVTESAAGRVVRVDPHTGVVTTFASGLPQPIRPVGGAMDVAFLDGTAYVIVTLVGADIGGSDVVGVYRIDGPNSSTVIADIGAFSAANPPTTPFGVPTGVQYAMQPYRGGFLVTDGHHNRVLRVTLDGAISEVIAFDNIVPTGLETRGNRVYMAEAGPVPHLPETGKIVSFKAKSPTVIEVASGARLLVDVEFGRGSNLYGLSQGVFPDGGQPGAPALPNTGSLVKVTGEDFDVVIDELNQPTSMEVIGNTAYIVTLSGEIWKIDHVSGPPREESR